MKKKLSILAVLLLAVVTTAYSVSGTYAKYTSTFTGTDTARVAKWAFEIDGKPVSDTFTFNLFNTVYDTNGDGKSEEDNIITNVGSIIAPGTHGSFDIKLKNASEVDANYAINFDATNNAGIPVEYSIDGTNWFADINYIDITSSTQPMNSGSETTVTVYWQWPFDDSIVSNKNDAKDTALGLNGTYTIKVTAEVTVTQVD